MPARAMWKARVVVGKISVPVKLYAAVRDAKVHFRLLHAADQVPVTQIMFDPVEQQPVERQEVVRALEVEKGVFVSFRPEELARSEPEPSREIHVQQVVPVSQVDARWFDRPYYLGPDGDDAAYAGLVEALGEARVAVARWTMRKKRYVGLIRIKDQFLMVQTLRHPQELVNLSVSAPQAAHDADPREKQLAEQLIAMLEGAFEPNEFQDAYQQRVRELVSAKAEGKLVQLPQKPEQPPQESLLENLQASVEQMKRAAHG